MNENLKWAAVGAGCAGTVVAVFLGGQAWAGGIPTTGALTYSGLLQDGRGAPLSGTQYVEVKFWNDASANATANLLCDTGTPTGIGLVNGRFSIALPDKCTTQVSSNAGIWSEVIVGATTNAAASLGRAKLGAVPFAVEANRALTAESATMATFANAAAGALELRIKALESWAACPGDPTAPAKYGFCIWRDDNGKRYSQTYKQAAATCTSKGARLCSTAEVSAAWAAGATWCSYAWVSETVPVTSGEATTGYQSYPMQTTGDGCHAAGVNFDSAPLTTLYDANCCK